jgi:hypothetical protein
MALNNKQIASYKFSKTLAKLLNKHWIDVYKLTKIGLLEYNSISKFIIGRNNAKIINRTSFKSDSLRISSRKTRRSSGQ